MFDTKHPEHNEILTREGNQGFYIGYVHPATNSRALRNNIEANAALTLIRALQPKLNDRSLDPEPPAGNKCCMAVFSCFYSTEMRNDGYYASVDSPPVFPVIVASNPYANDRRGSKIKVYAPVTHESLHQDCGVDSDTGAVAIIDDF